MKSLTAVCQTGASMPAVNPNGRITRHHPPQRADGENAEMKMYLSKLKDLVPFMPKNRKLSKLEIIQHVIDYICDLQTELESHPEINNFDATIALNISNNNHRNANHGSNNNNIFNKVNIFNGLQQQQQQQQQQEHDNENDVIMPEETQERLQQNTDTQQQVQQQQQQQEQQQTSHIIQQQQSSPIQRQPLADRQTPNTILPPAKAIINASSSSSSSSSSFSSRIDSIQSQRQLFLSSNSTTTINFNTTLTTTAQLSVTDTNSTTAITATATSATIACNSPATATAASLIHNDTLTLNKKSDNLDKMKTDNADDISPPC